MTRIPFLIATALLPPVLAALGPPSPPPSSQEAPSPKLEDPAPAVPADAMRPAAPRRLEGPTSLDLEDAVGRSDLIVVARLVEVFQTTIVSGGSREQITEQYRFEPVRTLKGVYARDELLMTGQDLQIYRFADTDVRLERGALVLLLLGRKGLDYFNCNGAGTLGQSIPRLDGEDDPLTDAVDALIAATQRRDRAERVALLVDALGRSEGRAALPLLTSIGRRAAIAARFPGAMETIVPFLGDESPILREVAAQTLGALLAVDAPAVGDAQAAAVAALADALVDAGPDVRARVAILDAIAASGDPHGAADREPATPRGVVGDRVVVRDDERAPSPIVGPIEAASTIAEQAARLRAAAALGRPDLAGGDVDRLADLPLDAPDDLVTAALRALAALDPPTAADRLAHRARRKLEAGLPIALEIGLAGSTPAADAAPVLVLIAGWPLSPAERQALADSCRSAPDPRLVPVLAALLNPGESRTRRSAADALLEIDTDEAARALWPHFKEEADPSQKLTLAAFLGRHGFKTGYAYAIEHLSDPGLLEPAVAALAAIDAPEAVPVLRRIWAQSNDLGWKAASMRALARLGVDDDAPAWHAIAGQPDHPLAGPALLALADLGRDDPSLLRDLHNALDSRSDALAIAAARSAALLLPRAEAGARIIDHVRSDPAPPSDNLPDGPAVRDRLAALLADRNASVAVREASLDALLALDDPRLEVALGRAARDAGLEGTPLLSRVESELARRSVRLDLADADEAAPGSSE